MEDFEQISLFGNRISRPEGERDASGTVDNIK
jgi:hypothetical protein